MRKIVLKVCSLLIVVMLLLSTKIYAARNSSFSIEFQQGIELSENEAVEVPILMNGIDFEGLQKGILAFSFQIEYDTDNLELEKYPAPSQNKPASYFKQTGEEISSYQFTDSTLAFAGSFNTSDYQDEIVEIGRIKVKAKANTPNGKYTISIKKIKGGNDDITVEMEDFNTYVYVKYNDEDIAEEETIVETTTAKGEKETTELGTTKTVVADIDQNDNGTRIYITIDAEKSTPVKKVLIDDKEMEFTDGKYTAETEPNRVYKIYYYDENGDLITMDAIMLSSDKSKGGPSSLVEKTEGAVLPSEEKKDDKEDTPSDDKKDDKEDDKKSSDDQKKDESKEDSSKNESKEGKKAKPVQTGDTIIIVATATVMLIVCANLVSYAIIRRKNA